MKKNMLKSTDTKQKTQKKNKPVILPEATTDPDLKPLNEIKGWKNKLIDKIVPSKTMLVNMELRNGMHRTFMTASGKKSFKFMGAMYIIDNELKYFKVDSKIWCLDYHQDYSLPIKKKIPLGDIETAIENSGVCEVETATNPHTLEQFVKSKVAEGVMKGAPIDEVMKRQTLLIALAMAASIIHLLLFVFKTGMLQGVKIPGLS